MSTTVIIKRQTKYCHAIERTLKNLGHATNAELLSALHVLFPDLSATTVHRATARLALRDIIAAAPPASDGSMRYDTNTKPHDHFECSSCGLLHDVNIKDKIIPIIESSIDGCSVSGQLIIKGICKKCMRR